MFEINRRKALSLGASAACAPAMANAQSLKIFSQIEMLQQEHQDRVTRLRRAADELGVSPPPSFSEFIVPALRMPASLRADTPVLRVAFAEKCFFDTASDVLRPEAAPILSAIAEMLRGDVADAAVFVAGHTDSRGGEAYNYDLSVRRADRVATALLRRGVGEVALWRVGFGEAVPLYPNSSPENMDFNRRVEFLFSARTEPVLDILGRQLETVCTAPDRSVVENCRRSIELRSEFEALQLTDRRRAIEVASDRRTTTMPNSRRQLELSSSPRSASAGPKRVAINLRTRRYAIAAPLR